MKLLGIRIDQINLDDARKKVEFFLTEGKHTIFTPNPEMLVKAHQDLNFREVLNSADLNLCDGKGIQLFGKVNRIPGVDFMLEICKIAETKKKNIFLLGSGEEKVILKTKKNLESMFPFLKICGVHPGLKITEGKDKKIIYDAQANDEILRRINSSGSEILFVAFGMGKQEKWIKENLVNLKNLRIAMGVGGAFDFISGKIRRAPCWMRRIGLEWIYRLIQEPKRISRIFNATVKFIYFIFIRN